MSVDSISSVASASAQVTLPAATRQILENLGDTQSALDITTQVLATNGEGLGQLVNILT